MPRWSLRSAWNNARAAETPLWYYILREADVRHEGPSWPPRLAYRRRGADRSPTTVLLALSILYTASPCASLTYVKRPYEVCAMPIALSPTNA